MPPPPSNVGPNGQYVYLTDLLALNTANSLLASQRPVDHRIARVRTPLNINAWQACLRTHPDQDFVAYILTSLEYGFHIGVNQSAQLQSAKRNMHSSTQNPGVINDYLHKEVAAHNILGPFTIGAFPGIHINRFGVIPKKHQAGKWRLITDLSFPEGGSVNDAIDSALCSLSYTSVDQVANAAMQLGKGALLAKIDIKSAYRLIPVHPNDRQYLGMLWEDNLYIDAMLPFGLRSAPKIFTAVADALEWCIAQRGVESIYHYLDDFLVMGHPGSSVCQEYLNTLEAVCTHLGVPLAPEKKDGPSPVLTFLGITIDTLQCQLRLPADKLQRLLDDVSAWLSKRACTRRELESLIGTLQHTCKVIHPGRSFLRRIITLLSVAKRKNHHIRLNAAFRSDMMWWKTFAAQWNGTSLIIPQGPPDITITSDASGTWGCGAWWGQRWFQLQWEDSIQHKHIAAKELIPILIALFIWGPHLHGKRVLSNCDNLAVVSVLNSRYSRDQDLTQLLRCLFFLEASFQFHLSASHISGTLNDCVDDLSRNRLSAFKAKVPHAQIYPSPIPSSLLQWLLHPKEDWTSPSWIQQFSTFLKKD